MNVKFTVDYDLIELVDAIGLDYNIVNAESDVINNYKEIEIFCHNIEDYLDDSDDPILITDEELCEYLLNPTICEGLIYTQRIN